MFEKLKDLYQLHKSKAVLCLCFVSVYIAGVLSANSFLQQDTSAKLDNRQSDYTTKDGGEPTKPNESATTVNPTPVTNTNTTQQTNPNKTSDCYIKGSKSKIYHLPGGAFYDRTSSPVACFNSEEEAQGAGYTKSTR